MREKQRYMILETIKQYGEEKLNESIELESILRNHLKFYMELAELVELKLNGPEMQTYLEELDSENGNFEKALSYSLKRKDIEEGLRLAGALGNYWKMRGRFSEGRHWLEGVLENNKLVAKPVRAKALRNAGNILPFQGEFEIARKLIKESCDIYLMSGNKSGLADSLISLGNVEFHLGNFSRAQYSFGKSLEIQSDLGDKRGIASSLNGLGLVSLDRGEYEKAQKYFNECLEIFREMGNKYGIAVSLGNLGIIALKQGKYERSKVFLKESLEIRREIEINKDMLPRLPI